MIVVADTSIFLNLCRIGQEKLLSALFSEVIAPEEVRDEFNSVVRRFPKFASLQFPPWVIVKRIQQPLIQRAPWVVLDLGESAAIELAAELNADIVLLDEEKGRRVAKLLGLTTLGILGVLLSAKGHGLLQSVTDVLEDLENLAGFWIAPVLRNQVLELACEIL